MKNKPEDSNQNDLVKLKESKQEDLTSLETFEQEAFLKKVEEAVYKSSKKRQN